MKKIFSIALAVFMVITMISFTALNLSALESDVATVTTADDILFYSNLSDAIDMAQNAENSTVTLLADTDEEIYIEKGKFTIDLNGNTWKSDSITLKIGNADVLITDKSAEGDGMILSTGRDTITFCSVDGESGKLEVAGGTVETEADTFAVRTSDQGNPTNAQFILSENGKAVSKNYWSAIEVMCGSVTIKGGDIQSMGDDHEYYSGLLDFSQHPDPAGIAVLNCTSADVPLSDTTIKLPEGYCLYHAETGEVQDVLPKGAGFGSIIGRVRTADPVFYSVTVNDTENGSVSASVAEAKEGDTVTLTVTAEEKHELVSLTVVDEYGGSVPVENNSFIMPAGKVTVDAYFERCIYTNIIEPVDHVTVKFSNGETEMEAQRNTDIHFTVSDIEEGYVLTGVTYFDGVEENNITHLESSICSEGTYSFETMYFSGAVIKAHIAPKVYYEDLTDGYWLYQTGYAEPGKTVTVEVLPYSDFVLETVSVKDANGDPVTVTDNQFIMPETYVTISAAFHAHQYSDNWKSNGDAHWRECSCGKMSDMTAHTPGAPATHTKAQSCTECGRNLQPALGHDFSAEWSSDALNHWHACSCGLKGSISIHVPGAPATETSEQLCVVCSYVMEDKLAPATPPAVGGETEKETETAIGGEVETEKETETTIGGEVETEKETETAVGGEVETEKETETVIGGEVETEKETETAIGGEDGTSNDDDKDKGCKGAVGISTLTMLLVASAAAFVFKKKKNV